ncbi:MAG: hypothetical protein AB8B52_10115 [Winogradskyella sp.]|uniref:hypothetical protein n=1 Tax=Winogradskyella sp. TaxID=1883156 RepID=UPI00385E9950
MLIKISIVVSAFYFIYAKLTKNAALEFSQFWSFLNKNDAFSIKTVFFLVILSSFNWFFEILKWQYLVKTLKPFGFISALEQSLGGHTAAVMTPNRIGDYGAKALFFAKSLRPKILLLNLLGHMAQMTITVLFGSVGLILFVQQYQLNFNYHKMIPPLVLLFMFGVILVVILKQKRFKIKGFSVTALMEFTRTIPFKIHGFNLAFSLIRYLIFSFQFYYLLVLFGVPLTYYDAMIIITSMYLLASVMPTISIFDVIIKGSIAVFLFGFADINELTILSITSLMWLLNFVIPSIFGSYFVLNFKLPKPLEPC